MKLSEVVGHQKTKENLLRSIVEGRVSHAQLFLAPEGSGGLPLALAFAQYMNCENRGETDSCGVCPSCNKMNKLIHPDVHFSFPVVSTGKGPPLSSDFIREWREAISGNPYLSYFDWLKHLNAENKQGNITIRECREIINKISLKAFEGKNKIIIMWMPEKLGKEGNALLKVMEEPSPDTYFILVAENTSLILNTIISRTQVIRLPALKNEDITNALVKRENLMEGEAAQLAKLADGNYNLALQLSRSDEGDFSGLFIQWMRLCYKREGAALLHWVRDMAKKGREEQKRFLNYGLHFLEDIFLLSQGLEEQCRLQEKEKVFAKNFSGFLKNSDQYNHLYEAINKSHYYIERNASSKIVFFNLSLQINKILRKEQAVVKEA